MQKVTFEIYTTQDDPNALKNIVPKSPCLYFSITLPLLFITGCLLHNRENYGTRSSVPFKDYIPREDLVGAVVELTTGFCRDWTGSCLV